MKRVYRKTHAQFLLEKVFPLETILCYPDFSALSTDEALDFLTFVEKFTNEVLAPTNQLGDQEGVRFENGNVIIHKKLQETYNEFCKSGILPAGMPTEWGGLNVPETLNVLIREACAAGNLAMMVRPLLVQGVFDILEKHAPEWIRKSCLPKLAAGKWGACMDITEEDAGSNVGGLKTIATEVKEENAYIGSDVSNIKTLAKEVGVFVQVKGTKCFISNGDGELENTLHLTLVRFPDAPAGTAGLSLVLIPKMFFDENGVITGANDVGISGIEEKMGIRASATCTVLFGENGKCFGWLIGPKNGGFKIMAELMNASRAEVGIISLGNASKSYERAVAYAKERVQFDQPIINFEDVRRMLLEMKARVEGLRALCCSYGYHADMERCETGDAQKRYHGGIVHILTPLIKILCTEAGIEVPGLSLLVHGGLGYTVEGEVEQDVRDGYIGPIYEGTNGIQAIHFMTRVLPKHGDILLQSLRVIGGHCDDIINHGEGSETEGAKVIKKAVENMVNALFLVNEWARKNEKEKILFNASRITKMVGNGFVGYMHVRMTQAAWKELKKNFQNEAKYVSERYGYKPENPYAMFLAGVIRTAEYFINYLLPRTQLSLEDLREDTSEVLAVEF